MANSPYTVFGESMSAGRIYDKIGETASAKVVYVLHNGVICKIRKKDLNDGKKKKEEPGGAEDGCDILVHIP